MTTSTEALNAVKPKLKKQHEQIVNTMRETSYAMAAEQIADRVGAAVWRRMSELEKNGIILKTGELHVNRTGRKAHKYRLAS